MGNADTSERTVARRLAALLIAMGVLFGADMLLELSLAPKLWPLLITILSVGLIGISLMRARRFYLLAGLILVSLAAVFSVVLAAGARFWWMLFVFAGLSILISEKAK